SMPDRRGTDVRCFRRLVCRAPRHSRSCAHCYPSAVERQGGPQSSQLSGAHTWRRCPLRHGIHVYGNGLQLANGLAGESMKTLITEFISLDGVVQAPGGPKEDTDGGFTHGGWSMKYFDPAVMGGTYTEL